MLPHTYESLIDLFLFDQAISEWPYASAEAHLPLWTETMASPQRRPAYIASKGVPVRLIVVSFKISHVRSRRGVSQPACHASKTGSADRCCYE
jgi:hypothetical protein